MRRKNEMNQSEFERIMKLAIEAETEAYEFYRDVSEKVTDASVKKIYQEFAQEELGHRTLLEQILKHDIKTFSFTGASDYKVSETVELPRLSLELKPVDAIALAMKKEEEAMKTYSSLAALSADPQKQKIFSELAKMEEGHKARMESLYTNTAFPEVW